MPSAETSCQKCLVTINAFGRRAAAIMSIAQSVLRKGPDGILNSQIGHSLQRQEGSNLRPKLDFWSNLRFLIFGVTESIHSPSRCGKPDDIEIVSTSVISHTMTS